MEDSKTDASDVAAAPITTPKDDPFTDLRVRVKDKPPKSVDASLMRAAQSLEESIKSVFNQQPRTNIFELRVYNKQRVTNLASLDTANVLVLPIEGEDLQHVGQPVIDGDQIYILTIRRAPIQETTQ